MLKPLDENACLPWESTTSVEMGETSLPGVSIVIPIYNAGTFLEKTLRSLMCNDLTGCEVILMDGGSTDNTQEIVSYYSHMFNHVTSAPDAGQSDAINKGFAKSTKSILYWLNGDDIMLPNALLPVRRHFHENPDTNVLVGDAFMTELDFTPIRHFQFSEEKLQYDFLLEYASNHLIQPSVFFTRNAWETCGPLDLSLHYSMDADLFISMAKQFKLKHLPQDIAYSVYHEDCKTRGKRAESIAELAHVQTKWGGTNQARRTLNILVDLYNTAVSQQQKIPEAMAEPEHTERCTQCQVLHARLLAERKEYEKNRDLHLQAILES